MKRIIICIAILIIAIPSILYAQSTDITIIHTNDMHSRMLGFSPNSDYTPFTLNDDATRGGMARIKTMMDTIRANETNVFMVDAGDFLMGTVFQTLEPQTGFQLRLMKQIGWDVVAIGNHEFDFGVDGLTEILTSATINGAIPPLLLSNIIFCDTVAEDDELEVLYNKGVIAPFYMEEKGGVKVAFFSLLGKDAYNVAPYAKPLTTIDQAETAVKMNDFLRNKMDADVVVALSHSGVYKDENGQYALEDVDVAMACPELDLIVSGHTHTVLDEPLMVNSVPIVQTGEYTNNLGRTVLSFVNGDTKVKEFELLPVDDSWQGNAEIQTLVEEQMTEIDELVLGDLGMKADSVIVETSFPLTLDEEKLLYDSNLGPFIADAIYHYYKKFDAKVDFTLVAAGLLRDNILPGAKGLQCATDLYRVLPLGRGVADKNTPGYSLATIYVTGHEIKNIMEIMQIAPAISSSNMPYWSGVRYSINSFRPPLDKVYEVELKTGDNQWQKIDISKKNETLYAMGSNAYLLEFVGMIKDLSKGILSVIPKNKNGVPVDGIEEVLLDIDPQKEGIQEAKEWAALMDFCATFNDINGNGIPDIPAEYDLTKMIVSAENPDEPMSGTMIMQGTHKIINLRSPVKHVSISPITTFRASNGVTLVVFAIVTVMLLLLFFLIRFIIRKVLSRRTR